MTGAPPLAAPHLPALVAELQAAAGLAHKGDIAGVTAALGLGAQSPVRVGDDCAALPNGAGWLLLAGEGFLGGFVNADPWFAGYCSVMVNLSDIAAMGGRPEAILDILWAQNAAQAAPILAGMRAAAEAYGVPVVGGHCNLRSANAQLGAAVLGRAHKLITSFDARPGDQLVYAVDLRGRFREPDAYWDASTTSPAARLREDLEILPELAEAGLARAGKDISMAGFVGTTLMLLEGSGVGAQLDLAAIPRPATAPLKRWLTAFPSFGYVLSVAPEQAQAVIERFERRGIAAAVAGEVVAQPQLHLRLDGEEALFWDLAAAPLTGCGVLPSHPETVHA
ncbi:sll0787 family AIR synthase-like protein [Phenylobacterium sp. LjRoot225]|uniref:sll0787 family AIR synthase-like protein n=1 Tax=Phenylobacterium sp. LjRoot225 TaxID=3342285 RepID=UPI003ECCBA95